MKTIPYNMNYNTSDDLREYPEDAEQMRNGVDFLVEEVGRLDNEVQIALEKGLIGGYYRILGNYNESLEYLEASKTLYKKLDRLDAVVAIDLRIATTYSYMKKYSTADAIFRKWIDAMRSTKYPQINKYLDFACQHLGKSRFEQGFFQEALDLLLEAHQERIMKGDIDLIKSTEHAISIVKHKLDEIKKDS